MAQPRVSIIIVTWNALPLLERFLPSVVQTDYPDFEIIIADNASTDGSADWVRATYPEVTIMQHPENWAFCRGNNEAIRVATGDYIVLLNNDVEVPPGWLSPLVRMMESKPDVAAIQPKMLQYEKPGWFEYAGAAGGHLDRFGYPFARGRIFFTVEADSGQYDQPQYVFWATGAAVMLRRRALDTVGLLDEQFYLHMEEIDLCWRLQRAGYLVMCEPASTVFHLGGGSLPQGDVRKVYYNFRNGLLLLYKNLPRSEFVRVFPARLVLDFVAILRALILLKPREVWAIVRAYRDFKDAMKAYGSDRGSTADGVLPDYDGSVVWDYFFLRRRRFRDLPPDRFRRIGADQFRYDSD